MHKTFPEKKGQQVKLYDLSEPFEPRAKQIEQTLTKHVANVPVSRQRPQLILAPGVALVVVPGKLHHLQHEQRADILVIGLIAKQLTSEPRRN